MKFFREVTITWRIIQNDYNTTLIPITIYFLLSASHQRALDISFVWVLTISAAYSLAYIVPFCLANQIRGVEEDKLEKPYRPLAAGLITLQGAWIRYNCWNMVLICISGLLGWNVLAWSCVWMTVTVYHNFLGGDKHFLTKNVVCMTLGTAAQFGAAWHTYHPSMPQQQQIWMWMIATWIGVLANIQDFRDMQGDLKMGRKTLPILWGHDSHDSLHEARAMMAFGVVVAGLALQHMLTLFYAHSIEARTLQIIFLVWHGVLALRVMSARTRLEDHITYKYYLSFFYCAVALSSFVFL